MSMVQFCSPKHRSIHELLLSQGFTFSPSSSVQHISSRPPRRSKLVRQVRVGGLSGGEGGVSVGEGGGRRKCLCEASTISEEEQIP